MNYVGGREQLNKDVEMLCSPIADMERRLAEYRAMMSSEGFWQRDDAEQVSRDYGKLTDEWTELLTLREAMDFAELMEDESFNRIDDDDDLVNAWNEVEGLAMELKHRKMLSGEYDKENAILTLHAGSGGAESESFVEMIMRMILRWGDSQHYKMKITDKENGSIDGIKSLTIECSGRYAYGYLKTIHGVWRLIRNSPYDKNNCRHTSFMGIDVIPKFANVDKIEVKPDEIEWETMRTSTAAGGQATNKNETAVRLRHIPTGIAIRYDVERSQYQNKACALELLKNKLMLLELEKRERELNELRGEAMENGWGSQIATITLTPYQLVKDERTGWTSGNTTAFLDGEIDDFIRQELENNLGG